MSFRMYACFYLAITGCKEKKEYKEKNRITYFLHKELKFLLYSLCVEIALTDSSCSPQLIQRRVFKIILHHWWCLCFPCIWYKTDLAEQPYDSSIYLFLSYIPSIFQVRNICIKGLTVLLKWGIYLLSNDAIQIEA